MPLPTLSATRWQVLELDVSWPERTNDEGTRQRRRQLSASVSTEIDAYSVLLNGPAFDTAPSSVTGLIAYVGDGTNPALEHQVTFFGAWQRTNLHTSFDGGRARLTQDIWRYQSDWEDIPEAP